MLAINIPADALFLAIQQQANFDFSESTCIRIVENYIDRYLEAKPDIIFLNVCYRRSLTPSEVHDSYLYDVETDESGYAVRDKNGNTIKSVSPVTDGVTKYFASFFVCARQLLKNGIDIYRTITQRIHHAGCKVYLSIRMNDVHYTERPAVNSYFAQKDGSRHTVEKDGFALDFSQKAVQNHLLEYIQELLDTYYADGIELDWLRHPLVLPKAKRSDFSILNRFMADVRGLLDQHRKDLGIAVRMLPTEQEDLQNGMDASQWIIDGNADILTIENYYIPTNFEPPVQQWRDSIAKKNPNHRDYLLLCGSDWAVSCVHRYNFAMTPALVRGFTDVCLYNGADGVYLFNMFEENDTSSFELTVDSRAGAYLKKCFSERLTAPNTPEALPRRYVHMGASNSRYPVCLSENQSYVFSQHIQKPFGICKLVIGCDTDVPLSVCLNGTPLDSPLLSEPVFDGYAYIPEAEIGSGQDFIYAVSQAAPYVKTIELPSALLTEDPFRIEIQNTTAQTAQILWLEVSCEQ